MDAVTITEFLEARIAEDEAVAETFRWAINRGVADKGIFASGEYIHCEIDPARVLAECAAKRAIIHQLADAPGWLATDENQHPLLRALATVYADHPDYRQEWAL